MRFRTSLVAAAALACCAAPASAADPAPASPSVAAAPGPAAMPPSPAAPGAAPGLPGAQAVSPWRHAWEVTAGLGFYERANLGVAYRPSPESSIGLFGGTDFGAGAASVNAVGLSYARALANVFPDFELGWDAKALYWAQYSPDYDWKMLSIVGGGYLARDVRPGLRLALDAGVSVNFARDVVRKQNVHFEYPTRWNGSVCLALQYRFKAW